MRINQHSVTVFFLCSWAVIILASCTPVSNPDNAAGIEQDSTIPQVTNNEKPDEVGLEEVLPDSGVLMNINPDEIITDDWNSGSPTELEIE